MSSSQTGSMADRRTTGSVEQVRLDLLENPYGASIRVMDALSSAADLGQGAAFGEGEVVRRLAQDHGVVPRAVFLTNGVDELLTTLLCWWKRDGRAERGPVLLFPPHDPDQTRHAAIHGLAPVNIHRGPTFRLELDLALAAELPPRSLAIVDSPNDPTGAVLGPQEAVRLSRACEVVVIDERHTEYGARTLLPLVREFENVVVFRTLETWAGLSWLPLAYAVGPPAMISEMARYRPSLSVARGALAGAAATMDDIAYVLATVRRVREERSRLYRSMRKLNMVRPFPSWANFLLLRVERGGRETVVRELLRRDIVVHRPSQPGLEQYIRVSATRPEQTDALRNALIDLAVQF